MAVQGKEFSKVKLLDVGMYPSIVVNLEAGNNRIQQHENGTTPARRPAPGNAYKRILNARELEKQILL